MKKVSLSFGVEKVHMQELLAFLRCLILQESGIGIRF